MYLATHEGEPPTGDFHPQTHAHAGRTHSAPADAAPLAVQDECERSRFGALPLTGGVRPHGEESVVEEQGINHPNSLPPDKGRPKRDPGFLDRRFFDKERLTKLAALAAKVQGVRINQARAPRTVLSAIRELNEIAVLAAATELGLDGAERLFQERLASARSSDRPRNPGGRSKAIVSGLNGLGGLAGKDRPCGDPIARAEEVLQTAFSLDVRKGGKDPTQTYQAGAYIQGRMRTVAQFEGALWREAAAGPAGVPGDEGPGLGRGRQGKPPGGLDGPSEPILPPDMPPLPDPPEPGGPGDVDPGLCEHIGELCMELFQEATAALLTDPLIDLLATVEPNCLCHDYNPNQIFVGKPAQGREFPVPLPADVRLIFRGTDITGNIIPPVTRQEIRFTIPPNSQTGYVYLRGLFPAEQARVPHPERLCRMDIPDFPRVPVNGPPALISIIFPPVIESVTANGEPGPVVVVESCHEVDVCWHVHLCDQAPNLPLPPCGRIQ